MYIRKFPKKGESQKQGGGSNGYRYPLKVREGVWEPFEAVGTGQKGEVRGSGRN